jgi:hypothetical protein
LSFARAYEFIAVTAAGDRPGRSWSLATALPRASYAFAETEVMDWLISHPDGSEEGNFVGKFLDTYQYGDGS